MLHGKYTQGIFLTHKSYPTGEMPDIQQLRGAQALAISPNRHYLAVSECREQTVITIYDLQREQCSKRQVLKVDRFEVHECTCMTFSADSKYLLVQSGRPKWTLFYWEWERNEVISTVTTTRLGFVSQVKTLSCSCRWREVEFVILKMFLHRTIWKIKMEFYPLITFIHSESLAHGHEPVTLSRPTSFVHLQKLVSWVIVNLEPIPGSWLGCTNLLMLFWI